MPEKVNILIDRAMSLAASAVLLVLMVIVQMAYTEYVVDKHVAITTVIYVLLGITMYNAIKDSYKLVNIPKEYP